MPNHSATKMIDDASAQIEIVETIPEQGDISSYIQIVALASFYWEEDQDWSEFVQQVTSIADNMFAEFNNNNPRIVTQYIQFKTGGVL